MDPGLDSGSGPKFNDCGFR